MKHQIELTPAQEKGLTFSTDQHNQRLGADSILTADEYLQISMAPWLELLTYAPTAPVVDALLRATLVNDEAKLDAVKTALNISVDAIR